VQFSAAEYFLGIVSIDTSDTAMLNYAGKAGEAGKAGNGDTAPLQLTMAQNMSAVCTYN